VDHVPLLPKLASELAAMTCELRHPKGHERRLCFDGNSGQAVMRAPSPRRGEGWGEVAWSLEAKPLTRSLTRSGLFPRGETRREKGPQRFRQSRTSSGSSPILPLHVADSPPPCRSSIGQTSRPLAAQDNAISARRRFAVPRTRCGVPCGGAVPTAAFADRVAPCICDGPGSAMQHLSAASRPGHSEGSPNHCLQWHRHPEAPLRSDGLEGRRPRRCIIGDAPSFEGDARASPPQDDA